MGLQCTYAVPSNSARQPPAVKNRTCTVVADAHYPRTPQRLLSEMEQPAFIFLNTTGATSLSPPAAKRMRAHITKTNFAKRRQQALLTRAESREQRKDQRQPLREREKPENTTLLPFIHTGPHAAHEVTLCKYLSPRAMKHWLMANSPQDPRTSLSRGQACSGQRK
jgi:hypothetical protein